MLYIILAWIFWFLFCFNIGYFALGLLFPKKQKDVDFFYNFWFGLFLLITVLQFISLFAPLNGKVLIALTAVNVLLLALNIKRKKPDFKVLFKGLLKKLDYRKVLLYGTLVLVLAFLANLPVSWPDTLGYHESSVKWLSDFGTVRGIANIHSRLGVNNVTFSLAAIMDSGVFTGASSHVMNSFLFIILMLQMASVLFADDRNKVTKFFAIGSFFVMSFFLDGQVNSLSTDFSLAIFVLISVLYTLILSKENICLAIPLYSMAATSKYSYFIVLILFLLYCLFQLKEKIFSGGNVKLLVLTFLFFVAFIVRNLLLSGWAFFPLPIFGIAFKWQVPVGIVKDFNDTVTAWARLPGPMYKTASGVGFWQWFPQWFNNNKSSMSFHFFMALPLLCLFYILELNDLKRNIETNKYFNVLNLLLFMNLSALIYTFITAPDFRFMNIYLFSSFSLIMTALLSQYLGIGCFKKVTICLLLFWISIQFLSSLHGVYEPGVFHLVKDKNYPVKAIELAYPDQSFTVWTPKEEQCANSQLPCTPYPYGFKMIVPHQIKKGFYWVGDVQKQQ